METTVYVVINPVTHVVVGVRRTLLSAMELGKRYDDEHQREPQCVIEDHPLWD